jgi:hypothetical protein
MKERPLFNQLDNNGMLFCEARGEMAEVGLLPFAPVTLEVATAVLLWYRSRFNKHQFTKPQLHTVLCMMRYEDWTLRETEVRLREHREFRRAVVLPKRDGCRQLE